jgi:hypothetical protein
MRYLILLSIFLLSFCTNPTVPREYKKMQKRVDKKERRDYRDSVLLSLDTINLKWYHISDSTLLGVPRIVK